MKSSDHSGRLRNGFPRVAPCSCDDPLGTGIRGEFSHAKSCDEDAVGSGAVLELEAASERLGKTAGTKFSVLQTIFSAIFKKMWFLTSGPLAEHLFWMAHRFR